MKTPVRIFLVDDDELIVTMLTRVLKGDGYEVRAMTSLQDVIAEIRSWAPAVVLLDIRLPLRSGIDILKELVEQELPTQVVMLTADDTAETAVKAMKLGAVDYLTKPFNVDEVKIVLRNIVEKGRLKREVDYLRKVHSELFDKDIVGDSQPVRVLKQKIEKMADAAVSTILMTGESGTGKELFARYAHRLIHHDDRSGCLPFIRVNCAALPENLLESELFGHARGSFTDAKTDKKGLFELAQGGSILLDEIGDMRLNLQGKLLCVLEERTVRPVGGTAEVPVDVTVIATTNRNMSEAVERGEFRMDLFFRLSTFYLHVPPLRERVVDIPLLARHFLSVLTKRYNKKTIKSFSPEAEKMLIAYPWPGNIRELRNLIERLVVLESAEMVGPEHLPGWLTSAAAQSSRAAADKFALPEKGVRLEDVEKDFILQALDRTKNNKAQAAKLLNISYDTLRYQVKKLGLE
ncbi:MAG: Fis family transcriptional regulator [Nitrospirae bacterium GWD2_57_9]|nr:MAG: Fis family transcriptional regulator [Nitrospirae bacterium GWD2_57_9]